MRAFFSKSRLIIFVAVVGLFIAGCTLLAAGILKVVGIVETHLLASGDYKQMTMEFLQVADIFLVAIALYLMSLGLYELFIDSEMEMPEWLQIHDFSALKKKLLDVIIVILAVNFIEKSSDWKGGLEILGLGASVPLVIAALTFFRKEK